MKKALITGASSGIGLELAKVMAERGHSLVLNARNQEVLEKVAEQLKTDHKVEVSTYALDLAQPGAGKRLHEMTKAENIEILVNNAGVGYVADFFDGDLERNHQMAQLNMVTLMDLCHYFGKDFVARGGGKILNVASIVSFFPGPRQPVYYASKAFVRSLSRALAYNYRKKGVTVTALHPGVTKTNFFNQASGPGQKHAASPRLVAEFGYKAMMAGKIEVTHGLWNKFLTNVFVRITPYRSQTAIVDRASDV